jgi:PEP-CTERM/exosortase A-associated glycosyltransferase
MFHTQRRLDQVVSSICPDVIHAHSPVLNALPALRVGRRHGIPVVYEVRALWEDAAVDHRSTREGSVRYKLSQVLETHALQRADAVTAICEGLRRTIEARGIPAGKVTVIPNAVDTDRFQADSVPDEQLRDALGLRRSVVLGFAGSFYAYEGLDLLLRALPLIAQERPNVKVLLIGGGPQEPELRRMVADLGLSEQVRLHGRVPNAEVDRYYRLIDLLVYPRRPMRLTDLVTPLKPLEAMAQGRILVASDVGGHRELIQDGQTGYLFAAGDAEALAERVLHVLAHREDWDAMRARGRQFVETQRNWRHSARGYVEVYRRVLNGRTVEVSA